MCKGHEMTIAWTNEGKPTIVLHPIIMRLRTRKDLASFLSGRHLKRKKRKKKNPANKQTEFERRKDVVAVTCCQKQTSSFLFLFVFVFFFVVFENFLLSLF